MSRWFLESIEINGGFLPGFSLTLPRGLTCIIGPRGSGKSTLVEAIRYGLAGITGAPKVRVDLVNGNLGKATLRLRTASDDGVTRYVIRRAHKQSPSVTTSDGKPLSVDLDRGTLLPLDGYSASEIETIADELGERRRALLDELVGEELRKLDLKLADSGRSLASNADRIRSVRETLGDLAEHIEELGDARAKRSALPPPTKSGIGAELAAAAQQQAKNEEETSNVEMALSAILELRAAISSAIESGKRSGMLDLVVDGSANETLTEGIQDALRSGLTGLKLGLKETLRRLDEIREHITSIQRELETAQLEQRAESTRLQEKDAVESQVVSERSVVEQQIRNLDRLEQSHSRAKAQLEALLEERKGLKANYLSMRDQISTLRESVAAGLETDLGEKVRMRVLRSADDIAYTQVLTEGLRGAGVRNHDTILRNLQRLRPEQLAQIILDDDIEELEQQISLSRDRATKVLNTFREKIDPLKLEVVPIEDRVHVELNVGSSSEPNFKDASKLSKGQKCTALLPLLIARRNVPIVIDQPEDNLDNHFIYETIVDTIVRAREERQMIFVTHNANIPVLGEADLVVVLNSDGKEGFVEREGTLDDCRDQIIDLLEGGREAFELRRQRYGQ